MKFTESYEDDWLVVHLVPGFIEAASNRQFGTPTVAGTRIETDVAAGAYLNKECVDYAITRQQAFAALCFEAGREYQRSRKLRKRIEDAVRIGWEKHNAKAAAPPAIAQSRLPKSSEDGGQEESSISSPHPD